jgi:hypothetical protein
LRRSGGLLGQGGQRANGVSGRRHTRRRSATRRPASSPPAQEFADRPPPRASLPAPRQDARALPWTLSSPLPYRPEGCAPAVVSRGTLAAIFSPVLVGIDEAGAELAPAVILDRRLARSRSRIAGDRIYRINPEFRSSANGERSSQDGGVAGVRRDTAREKMSVQDQRRPARFARPASPGLPHRRPSARPCGIDDDARRRSSRDVLDRSRHRQTAG